MKYILINLALASAVSLVQAADSPSDAPRSAASAVQRAPEAPPGLALHIEDVEVVATDQASKQITLKIEGQEETQRLRDELKPTLRVVRAGDKVRVYYEQADDKGLPRVVESVLITKPNREVDLQALRSKATSVSDASKGSNPSDRANSSDRSRESNESGQSDRSPQSEREK